MSEQTQYAYDVFISYALADQAWVWDELLPRLEGEGLKVIYDRAFEPGATLLTEMQRAALQSRKTLLILSPAYVESEWAEFENTLVQALDPAARKRRLIPVVLVPCEIQLRIRPLVSVDLATGDNGQWQRLLSALDPNHHVPVNPIQNLTLVLSEPSASFAVPGWHPLGSAWLALGLLGVVLLAGLVFLRLGDSPVLRSTIGTMVCASLFFLGLLGLREDKDFFKRLSHFLGKSHPAQAVMGGVLVAGILLWAVVGWPKVVDVLCGPLGCKPSGVQRLAIGEFKNLTPDKTELDDVWTQGTREALIQKLSRIPSLQLINEASPQTTEEVRRDLDYWIEGQFQLVDRAELRSRLSGRGGKYLSPDVRVEGEPTETLANITSLQNALALALLARLGVEPEPALAETLCNTPTGDMEALALNNEGVDLISLGDYPGAENKFRAALSLDPDFGVAHSNLAFVLAIQGDDDGAIAAYQAAVQRLPRYAVFHYNLGNLYLQLKRTDEALLSLQEAIRLDPGYIQAYNELGNVFILRQQWADARGALERGLALDPSFAPLHKNLARVALGEGKTQEAIDLLAAALQLYQEKPLEATYLLAVAYARGGQEAKACQQLAAYRVLDPNRIGEWAADVEELQSQLACP